MAKQTTIEDQFAIIEAAIEALEGGELGLEDSLSKYEAGLKAVKQAKSQLDKYAARLADLRGDDAQT